MTRIALHTPLLFIISIKILAPSTFTAVLVHSQQPPELSIQEQQRQPAPATWKWDYNHYSPLLPFIPDYENENDTSQPPSQRTRTLIIQSLPPGAEEQLLKITSRVNRAYAKRWGFDYVSYVGQEPYSSLVTEVFQMGEVKKADTPKSCKDVTHDDGDSVSDGDDEEDDDCTTRDADANTTSPAPGTIPSLYIPSPAVALRQYSTVMLLQSDAIIVHLDYNILDLIRDDQLISCGMNQKIPTDEGLWDVYSDVVLWNLKHPLFYNATQLWVESDDNRVDAVDAVIGSNSNESIVRNLVQVLMSMNVGVDEDMKTNTNTRPKNQDAVALVQDIPREMVSGLDGTVIKQARDSSKIQPITNHDLKVMMPVIQGISDTVCYRYYPQCEIVF